jgi:hypothetical protein
VSSFCPRLPGRRDPCDLAYGLARDNGPLTHDLNRAERRSPLAIKALSLVLHSRLPQRASPVPRPIAVRDLWLATTATIVVEPSTGCRRGFERRPLPIRRRGSQRRRKRESVAVQSSGLSITRFAWVGGELWGCGAG